jgi:hypothetical protein
MYAEGEHLQAKVDKNFCQVFVSNGDSFIYHDSALYISPDQSLFPK